MTIATDILNPSTVQPPARPFDAEHYVHAYSSIGWILTAQESGPVRRVHLLNEQKDIDSVDLMLPYQSERAAVIDVLAAAGAVVPYAPRLAAKRWGWRPADVGPMLARWRTLRDDMRSGGVADDLMDEMVDEADALQKVIAAHKPGTLRDLHGMLEIAADILATPGRRQSTELTLVSSIMQGLEHVQACDPREVWLSPYGTGVMIGNEQEILAQRNSRTA